jgi:hypothetical protein
LLQRGGNAPLLFYCSFVRNKAMHETIFTIYTTDLDTGIPVYQCETTNEELAQDEVDRINGSMGLAGRPCTAYYTP